MRGCPQSGTGLPRRASRSRTLSDVTRALPRLLDPSLFPAAELSALVLDGEARPVDDCAVWWAATSTPELRAAALRHAAGVDAVLVGASAGWVHGLLRVEPVAIELATTRAARLGASRSGRVRLGVVSFTPGDVEDVGGVEVVSPVCAAAELLRRPRPTADDRGRGDAPAPGCSDALLHAALLHPRIGAPLLAARLGRERLAGVRRARERLARHAELCGSGSATA